MLSDKLYNCLKWISIVCIPAVTTFLATVLPALQVDVAITNTVTICVGAVGTLLGALIGISTAQYNKSKEE